MGCPELPNGRDDRGKHSTRLEQCALPTAGQKPRGTLNADGNDVKFQAAWAAKV